MRDRESTRNVTLETRPDNSSATAAIRQRIAGGLTPSRCACCGRALDAPSARVVAVRWADRRAGFAALHTGCPPELRDPGAVLLVVPAPAVVMPPPARVQVLRRPARSREAAPRVAQRAAR